MIVRSLCLWGLVACASACSSQGSREEASPPIPERVLPYTVFLERVELATPAEGTLMFRTETELRQRFSEAVVNGLEASGTFIRVADAESLAEGRSADISRKASDLIIRVTLEPLVVGGLPRERVHTGPAVFNSVVWFLAMVPAWFMADREYDPVVRVSFAAMQHGTDLESKPAFEPKSVELSFNQRSSVAQYVFQVFVPPALVPSDMTSTRESLVAETAARIENEVREYYRERFAIDQVSKGEPFLVPVAEGTGRGGTIICLPGKLEGLLVDETLPPASSDTNESALYFLQAEQNDVKKLDALELLRSRLGKFTGPVPSAARLAELYPRVYFFDDLSPGSRERKIRIAFRSGEDGQVSRVTWTLAPALLPTSRGFQEGHDWLSP
jgi:hypothetical protein